MMHKRVFGLLQLKCEYVCSVIVTSSTDVQQFGVVTEKS